jgi:hypothetical protein
MEENGGNYKGNESKINGNGGNMGESSRNP